MTFWTGIEGTELIAALMITFAIQTAVLGASVWLLSGDDDNPFRQEGQLTVWGKCAGLIAAVMGLSFLPAGAVLAMVGGFVGITMLFQRNLGEPRRLEGTFSSIGCGFAHTHLMADGQLLGCGEETGLGGATPPHGKFVTVLEATDVKGCEIVGIDGGAQHAVFLFRKSA